jgi:hypothetical protein
MRLFGQVRRSCLPWRIPLLLLLTPWATQATAADDLFTPEHVARIKAVTARGCRRRVWNVLPAPLPRSDIIRSLGSSDDLLLFCHSCRNPFRWSITSSAGCWLRIPSLRGA